MIAVQSTFRFRVRPCAGESGFVIGSWLRSYEHSPWVDRSGIEEYWAHHPRIVSALVDRSHALVAEHEETGLLLGFAVGERDDSGPIVHYVYTKKDYQSIGVGRALVTALLGSLGVDVGELTRVVTAAKPFSEQHGTIVRHALSCGHDLVWRTQKTSAPCFECMAKPVRYSHTRKPGSDIAGKLHWRYTPYPMMGVDRR